ncbi:unnamed protein product [Nesidiocoris tenuis]|uniref:Uncharacterized protein n=1 Tax=Nesidiocoris tenuis TaxID=355587 RepID=A0A6H5FX00_9HEMI|nr:unnamed protein product [Nesidiocoris tenuis]CAA9994062.1 unnamed protein product [Nesidiocoris tenuis]
MAECVQNDRPFKPSIRCLRLRECQNHQPISKVLKAGEPGLLTVGEPSVSGVPSCLFDQPVPIAGPLHPRIADHSSDRLKEDK